MEEGTVVGSMREVGTAPQRYDRAVDQLISSYDAAIFES
jgi:hypothetical protein